MSGGAAQRSATARAHIGGRSPLRPVALAAATTVLGVTPLRPDALWVSMAVTMMFGLAFGLLLTMLVVPVPYACLFRIPSGEEAG